MISKSWSTSKKRAVIYREAGELAEFCLQLFPLLVVHSDDYGRLDADPETVKLVCDPGSPRPVEEFDAALTFFERVGLIQRYQSQRVLWLQISNFDGHQPGLLSKRTEPKSPAPPTDTEVPGNSVLTKPNLTQPNLTKQNLTVSSQPPAAQELVDLWNQLVTAPIPKVTKITTDRRARLNARLKEVPNLALWRTVITWLNGQDWCRASGKGDHPNWTATLDWLCKSAGHLQRYIENSQAAIASAKPRERPSDDWYARCQHVPKCGSAGIHDVAEKIDRNRAADRVVKS